jgi:hypothetical protein
LELKGKTPTRDPEILFQSFASSGEFAGELTASMARSVEEPVKLLACRIEGTQLRFLRFHGVDQRTAFVVNSLGQGFAPCVSFLEKSFHADRE